MAAVYKDGKWYVSESSGHIIKDGGVAVTPRESVNFIDHDISDDSVNNEIKIRPHRLTGSEFDEIIPDFPIMSDEKFKHFTAENLIGTWIDGKPLYQRTLVYNGPFNTNDELFKTELANVDYIHKMYSAWVTSLYDYESDFTWNTSTNMYCNAASYLTGGGCVYTIVRGNLGRTISKLIVTVQYTKTTD